MIDEKSRYGSRRIKIRYEEGQEWIRRKINEMQISKNAEEKLIHYSLDLYDKIEQDKIMLGDATYQRAITSIFLACDRKACITIPKLKRVCSTALSIKKIADVREALNIPRVTAHDKLDSLCLALDIQNKEVIAKAHDYAGILEEYSYMPTNIAATTLYMASFRRQEEPTILLKQIAEKTGIGIYTIRRLSSTLMNILEHGDKTWVNPTITRQSEEDAL